MTTRIVLLRGIGGNVRPLLVKEAVAALEELGLRHVRSYIGTGNFVFESRKRPATLAREIEACIEARFGFDAPAVVLGVPDLERALEQNPFPEDQPSKLHFFFLKRPAEAPRLDEMERLEASGEAFELREQVFYLYAPHGFGTSKLAVRVERLLGVPATARNLNTVRKVLALAKGG